MLIWTCEHWAYSLAMTAVVWPGFGGEKAQFQGNSRGPVILGLVNESEYWLA